MEAKGKAILLVRVSTTVQEMDEQEREVYELAKRDGYADEDIITISEKESAIKLSEEERAGLNRLKAEVEKGNVKDVYMWEVSRLARTGKVLFSMREYFEAHKIRVTIKAPNFLRILEEGGERNSITDLVFSIYAHIAESEMRIKLERFKRSKDARRKQGYFTGGTMLYGYTSDETKRLVPYEPEAKVVKMIFAMYLTGKYSYRSLAKELRQMGFFTDKSPLVVQNIIKRTLYNTAYAGLPSAEGSSRQLKTQGNIYPAIVSLEVIERCKAIAQNNMVLPKKKYSTYYFGKSILRCPNCGKIMRAVKGKNVYDCNYCIHTSIININMVDSALWAVAVPLYTARLQEKDEGQKQYYESQIAILNQKIGVAEADMKGIEERGEKILHKAYVEGTMDIPKADAFIDELKKKMAEKEKEVEGYNTQITDFRNLLLEHNGDYLGLPIEEVGSVKDDKIRHEIVHQMISWATIRRIEGRKMLTEISIVDYTKTEYKLLLDSHRHKIYSGYTEDGIGLVEMPDAYEQRFKNIFQLDANEQAKKMAYQREYYKKHKKDNAERQRMHRERKKAEDKAKEGK